MKDKYWAKEKYSKTDPIDYEKDRFNTPAGKIIDEVEKKAALKLLIRYKNNSKQLKILDVATGSGRLAFYLEKHFPFADITGVDINENMLERAKQLAQENRSKVKFVKGDIYSLPFQDNQFDAVVGLRFSMHLPPIDKVIKELSRVLKSGGILIFDIFNYHSILRLKLVVRNTKKEDCGFYTIEEITPIAGRYKLKLLGYKGILFFGETLLRKFSDKLQFLISPFINPPKLIERYSTKVVLCLQK